MGWSHLIWEAFCMYDCAKDRVTETFKFKEDDNGEWAKDKKGNYAFISCGKHKNVAYIKGGEKKRPKWCKTKFGRNEKDKEMTPRPDCHGCPYLALSEVDYEEYIVMERAWEDAGKEGKFDHLEDGGPKSAPTKSKKGIKDSSIDCDEPGRARNLHTAAKE